VIDWLIEPFRFGFMQTALIGALLVAITCALVGCYVVLRRMAFIGDALAHTILPGVAVAYFTGANLYLGALIAALATAAGIGWLSRRDDIREDTAIGVMFTAMFALGVLMLSTANSFRDLSHILFGNILGVTVGELPLLAGVAVLTLVLLAALHKEFELSSYDPTHAAVIGVKPDRIRYLLLFLLTLAVVTSIQLVGVILTSALLVTPAAAAALITRRLKTMMLVSVGFAAFSCVVGLYLSYYFDVASGAAIVLTCSALFLCTYLGRSALRRTRLSAAHGPGGHAEPAQPR
jgi:manganese/iron transport system permease protein